MTTPTRTHSTSFSLSGADSRSRRRLALALGIALQVPLLGSSAFGQAFTFTSSALTYSENFDSMGATGTTYISGWDGVRGAGTGTIGPLALSAGTGSGNGGGVYNVGIAGAGAVTDRALGGLASGSTVPFFGASFTNNTGLSISSISLEGMVEQWRQGSSAAVLETEVFSFSLDATSLLTGTWTTVSAFNLTEIAAQNLEFPTTGTGTNTLIDGNSPGNRAAITANSSLNWVSGSNIWIRWADTNDAGNDALLAIDDFKLTVATATPARTILWSPTSTAWDTTTSNWTDTATSTSTTFGNTVGSMLGDNVSFTDAGLTGSSTVTIDAAGVSPSSVAVSNTTGTYTLTGGVITSGGGLVKSNGGTLLLDTTFTGSAVSVTGGILKLNKSDLIGDSSTVTVTGPGTFDLNGQIETIGALNINAGGIVQTGGGELTLGGNLTITATSGTAIISGFLNTGGAARNLNVADGPAAVDLQLDAVVGGTNRLQISGPGVVALNGANTGAFTVNAGANVILGNGGAFGTGQVFFNGGTISALSALTGSSAVTATFSFGPATAALAQITGTNPIDFAGAWIFFSTNAKTFTVENTTTLTGGITGTGAGSALTKAGAGTLILPGAASMVSLAITKGTVVASGATTLNDVPVTLNPGTGDTATLALKASANAIGALASGTGAGTSLVTLGDSTNAISTTLTLGSANLDTSFSGVIQDALGLSGVVRKNGTGRQNLAGANTYTGETRVLAGGLVISGSLNGSANIFVDGGSLAGTGTINLPSTGHVVIASGGTLTAGNTATGTGTLSIVGTVLASPNATLDLSAGTFSFKLGATIVGGSNLAANTGLDDRINLTGNVVLGGTLTGSLLGGFKAAKDDLFFILNNDLGDPISGRFAGVADGSTFTFGGGSFAVSYFGDSATNSFTGGNDLVLQALSNITIAIPEPGSFGLLLSGVGLLGLRRRRTA